MQSFPRNAFFLFVGTVFQSRSVFATFGTVFDKLLDIVIYNRPPALLNCQSIDSLMDVMNFFNHLCLAGIRYENSRSVIYQVFLYW